MKEKINKLVITSIVLSCIGVAASHSAIVGIGFGLLAGASSLFYNHDE